MKDHNELKRLAMEATPGPWQAYDTHGKRFVESMVDELHVVCETPKKQWLKDSEFIAAANPSTVLDLLEEISIADKIIAERDRLISAIPACPVHGQCVPHAIEWVEKVVLMMRMLKDENTRLSTKIETIRCLLGSSVPSDEQLDIAIDAAIRNGEMP